MTAKRPANTIQAQILEQLMEVKGKVDKSLEQGAENGKQIELIKLALGLDGAAYGRLPELEKAIARVDKAQENDHRDHERRIVELETGDQQNQGKKQLWSAATSFLSGSAGAAVVGVIAKMLGLIH